MFSPNPYQLVFHPLSSSMIIKVGHQVLSLKEVFYVHKPTQLAQSVVRTIKVSVLQDKNDALVVVILVTS